MMQARYLLEQVADEFCDLYSQEQMAKSMHMSEGINRNRSCSELINGLIEINILQIK